MRETASEQAARLGIRLPGDTDAGTRRPAPVKAAPVKRIVKRLPRRHVIDAPPDVGYGATEVCRATKLTYRQLDYYDRIDFISPSIRGASGSGGGKHRLYSDEDVRLLTKTKRFLDLGFRLSAIQRHGPDGLEELVRFRLGMVQVDA